MLDLLKRIGSFFLDFLEIVITAGAVFVVVYLFLFQPHQVKGSSMFPNFHDGEYILTDKISYRFQQPKRGDVVVFKAPRNTEIDFIKRIIGLPEEKVRISQNKIYVNGVFLKENYLPDTDYTSSGSFLKENEEILIPMDSYFVLGDNRSHSSDSREWGTVPEKNIIGKAWFRYWPPQRVGLIPRITY